MDIANTHPHINKKKYSNLEMETLNHKMLENMILEFPCTSRLMKLQRSDVQLSERLASNGHRIMGPLALGDLSTMVSRGLRGTLK